MSAYIIFNYKILDRSKINELTERVEPIDKKYGAEVIVGSPVKAIEGNALPNMVIYKFKNFDAAKNGITLKNTRKFQFFEMRLLKGGQL